ncbi:hypothetical protein ACOXY8_16205 [Cytophagales bacterium SYC-11]
MTLSTFIMRILALLCLGFFFYSCESEQKDTGNLSSSTYKLEITDSIHIDRMIGYPYLVATHPENGNLLMLSSAGFNSNTLVLIVSQKGEIVKEFEHLKEGPTSAGSNLISATFFEDGYAIMGVGTIVIYDADFNVKKRLKIPLDLGGVIYMNSKHLKVIEKDGRSHFLIFYGPKTEKTIIEAEYYDEYNLLTLVDPENESFESYGRFHEGSMYRSGKAFYFIRTLYEPFEGKTKVIASNDTVLYTLDDVGNELNRINIPFDEYIMFKGYSLGEAGYSEQEEMRDEPGEVLGLLHVREMDVISYKSGIPLDKFLDLVGPNRERYNRAEVNKANPQKVIILKDGELVSDVLSLPEKIIELSISDPFGNIWATQNVAALEEEPEVVTIYKLRIVEE